MLILGFGNKARQGKDSAAEAIREYYPNHMRWNEEERRMAWCGVEVGVFKFATALYQEVNEFLGLFGTRKAFSGPWLPINAPIVLPSGENFLFNASDYQIGTRMIKIPEWVTPEPNPEVSELAPYGKHPKLLQWWGTEFRRAQDLDYWTNKLFASIPANLDIALVTDVRFPNEADGIRQRGGYNVNVTRLRVDGSQHFSSDRPVDHPSETALDGYNWDFKLVNSDGHQALLGEQAITLCEYLRGLNE